MKKISAIMLAFALLFAFAACAGKEETVATTAATDVQTQAETADAAETTKISAVAGKTIMLKSMESEDFVEIHTNIDGIATVMKVHKFYADEASFRAALDKGNYGTYKLEAPIDQGGKYQIIYSDTETVSGMTYDEIMSEANNLDDYMIIEQQ